MPRLRDIVVDRPTILFVGINPGATSGRVGHHFAGPTNPFWKLLHASGLVPVELHPAEDRRLAEWRYALVNLCPRPTPSAADLERAELVRGRTRLLDKVRVMKPDVVALVGITLAPIVVGNQVAPGPGPKSESIEGARVFVLPNPSGRNAAFPTFESKLAWFVRLRELTRRAARRSKRAP